MKLLLKVILICASFFSSGQNQRIDSLKSALEDSSARDKINLINELAIAYWNIDDNMSLTIAREAIQEADDQRMPSAKARSYNIIGVAWSNLGEFRNAAENHLKSIEEAKDYHSERDLSLASYNLFKLYYDHPDLVGNTDLEQLFLQYWHVEKDKTRFNNSVLFYTGLKTAALDASAITTFLEENIRNYKDPDIKAIFYSGIGYYNKIKGNYFIAIHQYENALRLSEDPPVKLAILANIGTCYFLVGYHKQAIQFTREAIHLLHQYPTQIDPHWKNYLNTMLGGSYIWLEEYRLAVDNLKPGLADIEKYHLNDKLAVLNNLSLAYIRLNELDAAEIHLNEADKFLNDTNNKGLKLAILNTKAEFLEKKSNLTELKSIIDEIRMLTPQVSEYYILSETYKVLGNYSEKIGDFEQATHFIKARLMVNDSIKMIESRNAFSEFQVKYESSKKDQQIRIQENELTNKKKLITTLFISSLILIIALSTIIVLYIKRNNSYRKIVFKSLDEIKLIKEKEMDVLKIGNKEPDSVLKFNDQVRKHIEEALVEIIRNKSYLERDLTLGSLASKCGTNQSYMSQFINLKYGQNFNQFINSLRIKEASMRLAEGKREIQLKELYTDLGFNSYSVFNNAFKNIIGVTPAFFQRTVQKKMEEEPEYMQTKIS